MDAFLHIFMRIMASLLVQYNCFWGVIKNVGIVMLVVGHSVFLYEGLYPVVFDGTMGSYYYKHLRGGTRPCVPINMG